MLALFSLIVLAGTPTEGPDLRAPRGPIEHRFAVGRGGGFLLVPVRVAGRDRLFAVDTGTSMTVLDRPLVAGPPIKVVTAGTTSKVERLEVFRLSGATLAGVPIDVERVVALDMAPFRELSGLPIEGLLGMDFLRRTILHVDFDRGELAFLPAVPADPGAAFPLTWTAQGIPQVEASIAPGTTAPFSVDTEMVTCQTGTIEGSLATDLTTSHHLSPRGNAEGITAGGAYRLTDLAARRLEIGPFAVERPVFIVSPMQSTLGLRFLSRFVATFDFPASRLYLKAGGGYGRLDDLTSMKRQVGLDLVRRGDQIVVDHVRPRGPAAAAGFRAGEVLLTLGATRADEISLFDLRESLVRGGPVSCTVRQGAQVRILTLTRPR